MARPTLRGHRKFKRAMTMLNILEPHLLGHLEMLWEAAYASGNPFLGDALDVELAAGWRGEVGALAKALLICGGEGNAGFIETFDAGGAYQVHDLYDHAPGYVKRRMEKELQRQRAGVTISDQRRQASLSRWKAEQPDANAMQKEIVCMPVAAATSKRMQTDAPPAPAPAPAPAPTQSSSSEEESEPVPCGAPPLAAAAAEGGEANLAEEELAIGKYVRVVEAEFVLCRGKGLLLGSKDWQIIQRWYRQGRPLDVMCEAIRRVFERRRDRGAIDAVNSLAYCEGEADRAWRELREIEAPGERAEAPPLDIVARLAALAGSIPSIGSAIATQLDALGLETLGTEAAEARLADLDTLLLQLGRESLSPELAASVAARVEATMAHLAGRLDAAEVEKSRERLTRQILRQDLALPHLSLFSPDAAPAEEGRA